MSGVINTIVAKYMKVRSKRIKAFKSEPEKYQEKWINHIIKKGRGSEYLGRFGGQNIKNYEDFKKQVPLISYEDIADDVSRVMMGEKNVLWPGRTKWFAKSSGTTNAKSKFIPITNENFYGCHVAGSWETMTLLYEKIPDAQMFSQKSLLVGGTIEQFAKNKSSRIGDVSAILIHRMPGIGRPYYTPDFKTAVIPDWDKKLERITKISGKDNVVMIGGVPTWNIVLFRKMLEYYKADSLIDIWPNLQAYVHGGVSFTPYRALFEELIPKKDVVYQEIYNASEGFFAIQDQITEEGMLLLLDHGMFFEFLPKSEWHSDQPHAIPIWEVEEGKDYALVVTNNSGLWRYIPGDTVTFTTIKPYRIKITGRTKHFINAFGEEVMVGNTDDALTQACKKTGAVATEYTVAPVYLSQKDKGGHEWLIEFQKEPKDLTAFAEYLDKELQSLNSDYQAKRYKDIALQCLKIKSLPVGSFESWLRSTRTMGAQIKITKLSNNRKIIEDILSFLNDK